MFCILNPEDECDARYLAQMHNLRYRTFFQNLKWRNGLQVFSQMEFDQYDHRDVKYLVRINEDDCVDACARLTITSSPYLLKDTFASHVTEEEAPRSSTVLEISRLCADSRTAPKKITGQLMASILEFAIANGIEHCVSLSDIRIIPLVKRFGWDTKKIGPDFDTGTEISAALKYSVTEEFHENVRKISDISSSLYKTGNPATATQSTKAPIFSM